MDHVGGQEAEGPRVGPYPKPAWPLCWDTGSQFAAAYLPHLLITARLESDPSKAGGCSCRVIKSTRKKLTQHLNLDFAYAEVQVWLMCVPVGCEGARPQRAGVILVTPH